MSKNPTTPIRYRLEIYQNNFRGAIDASINSTTPFMAFTRNDVFDGKGLNMDHEYERFRLFKIEDIRHALEKNDDTEELYVHTVKLLVRPTDEKQEGYANPDEDFSCPEL